MLFDRDHHLATIGIFLNRDLAAVVSRLSPFFTRLQLFSK